MKKRRYSPRLLPAAGLIIGSGVGLIIEVLLGHPGTAPNLIIGAGVGLTVGAIFQLTATCSPASRGTEDPEIGMVSQT